MVTFGWARRSPPRYREELTSIFMNVLETARGQRKGDRRLEGPRPSVCARWRRGSSAHSVVSVAQQRCLHLPLRRSGERRAELQRV